MITGHLRSKTIVTTNDNARGCVPRESTHLNAVWLLFHMTMNHIFLQRAWLLARASRRTACNDLYFILWRLLHD